MDGGRTWDVAKYDIFAYNWIYTPLRPHSTFYSFSSRLYEFIWQRINIFAKKKKWTAHTDGCCDVILWNMNLCMFWIEIVDFWTLQLELEFRLWTICVWIYWLVGKIFIRCDYYYCVIHVYKVHIERMLMLNVDVDVTKWKFNENENGYLMRVPTYQQSGLKCKNKYRFTYDSEQTYSADRGLWRCPYCLKFVGSWSINRTIGDNICGMQFIISFLLRIVKLLTFRFRLTETVHNFIWIDCVITVSMIDSSRVLLSINGLICMYEPNQHWRRIRHRTEMIHRSGSIPLHLCGSPLSESFDMFVFYLFSTNYLVLFTCATDC